MEEDNDRIVRGKMRNVSGHVYFSYFLVFYYALYNYRA